MTLMIGSEELGHRLYESWRKRMDVIEPRLDVEPTLGSGGKRVASNRIVRRPRWEHLTSIQQAVWRDVARDIGGVLADAMGSL